MSSVPAGRNQGITNAPLPSQPPSNPDLVEQRAGASRLLSRLYRDVGMAAVAAELRLPVRMMDRETAAAIERGAALLGAQRNELAA
jgi:hypothetical protein